MRFFTEEFREFKSPDHRTEEERRKYKEILRTLLKNGIITTTMLRNLEGNFDIIKDSEDFDLETVSGLFRSDFCDLNDSYGFRTHSVSGEAFYQKCITSIDSPQERCIIKVEDGIVSIQKENTGSTLYDCLSPPWFLSTDDSMGKFKEHEMEKQDKSYGEAIVEVRMIFKIDSWFFKKMRLSEQLTNKFLKYCESDFIDQVMTFFDFLVNFDLDSQDIQSKICKFNFV